MVKKNEKKEVPIWTDEMNRNVFVFQPQLSSKNEMYGQPSRVNARILKPIKINNNPNKFG
jgi:hypothetical protein